MKQIAVLFTCNATNYSEAIEIVTVLERTFYVHTLMSCVLSLTTGSCLSKNFARSSLASRKGAR